MPITEKKTLWNLFSISAKRIRSALKHEQEKVEKKLSPKKSLSPIKSKKSLSSRENTDLRLRKTQIDSQSLRFFNVWNKYNEAQIKYREKSKKTLVTQFKIMGQTDLTNEQIEEMIDEGKDGVFGTNILDQERMERQKLLDLQTRHGEFMKVNFNIFALFQKLRIILQTASKLIIQITS